MFAERRKVLSGATTENDIVVIKNMSKVQLRQQKIQTYVCVFVHVTQEYGTLVVAHMLHRNMKH